MALAGGILVAGVAFTILTASAQTSAFRTRGTIKRNYRTAYDILVRPRGSATPIERAEGLVRNNYLSGIYGGISFRQYHEIERIPGVAVAAPVANVGYLFFADILRFPVKRVLTKAPFQLYRATFTFVANRGLSRYPYGRGYVYYTRNDHYSKVGGEFGVLMESGPDVKRAVPSCPGMYTEPLVTPRFGITPIFDCFAGPKFYSPGFATLNGHPATRINAFFPLALSAIDPVAEAKLVHLDHAITAGRYLRPDEDIFTRRLSDRTQRFAPALMSDRPYLDEKLEVRVERLRLPPRVAVPAALAAGACLRNESPCPPQLTLRPPRGAHFSTGVQFILGLRSAGTVMRRDVPLATFYRRFVSTRPTLDPTTPPGMISVGQIWRSSPVRYRELARDRLAPLQVGNSPSIWSTTLGRIPIPYDEADSQFRRLSVPQRLKNGGYNVTGFPPALLAVGRFDPRRLPGFSPLSKVPLETYYPPELEPANAASRAALHGASYMPTQNLGGYIAQPPFILTSLAVLKHYLLNPTWFGSGSGGLGKLPPRMRRAPISVIRVRVAGVRGPDPVSRERVRVVAQKIHEQTGLDVDVTVGSSPHPLLISLPKGRFGQPRLLLREGWSKKGVSVVFLNTLDRKSLALFALVLIVCSCFLANGAVAVTRTRRAEIGTLRTLGWSQGAIFAVLLSELALIGAAAGLVGVGVSLVLISVFSLDLGLLWAVLVLPLSVVLACLTALVPAWRAARVLPLAAVRPAASRGRSRRPVGHVPRLAVVNLRRTPGRTLVGGAGLAIGIAALTLLLAIERSYHGTLVGTLLGNALALEVRGADLAAIGLVIGLAAFSVADVLYVNLRERAAEIVTLRASGWSERHLILLVALEAAVLGVAGSVTGAVLGVALTLLLLSVSFGPLLVAAALAVVGGTLASIVASLLPLGRLRRLTTPSVLAAE